MIARGNRGRQFCRDHNDHQTFLDTLTEASANTGWSVLRSSTAEGGEVHAYVFMPERLRMGHYTRVAQAVSRLRRRPGPRLEKLRRKLIRTLS